MNILLLSWRGPKHPNAGGAEVATHEYAKGWIKAGHEVTLFTSYYQGAKKEENIDGVNIIRRGDQILGVHLQVFKWYLFESHTKYDLVVDQFHGIPFFTPIFVKAKKLAFIHEVAKEVWKTNFSLIPAKLGEMLEPLIFKLYKNIPFMTVSESTKKDLINWGIPENRITVIHNGINITKFKIILSKGKKKTLIFLGALSKDKGIEEALETFALINQKDKDWQFWVVGRVDPRYLKNLRIYSKRLRIDKKTKFWGYVSEEKKFELLAKAHVAINPSIREGWGLVVIEAASVGTPTVAYDVPGLKDSIRDGITGLLCKEQNPTLLAKSILQLLSNGKNYTNICDTAKQWSKKFSWEKATRDSLKLLEKIVK